MKYPKLKKDKFDKKWYIHFNKNTFLHFHNDWEQLFGKWNWYSLNFIKIYFEKEDMVGGMEFEFIILGLGFRFRWNDEKLNREFHKKYNTSWVKKQIKKINDKKTIRTVRKK